MRGYPIPNKAATILLLELLCLQPMTVVADVAR
jgi:hypothetical protein